MFTIVSLTMTADEHIPKDSTNRIFSLKNATSNDLINWLQVYNIHLSNLNKAFNIFLNLLIYIKIQKHLITAATLDFKFHVQVHVNCVLSDWKYTLYIIIYIPGNQISEWCMHFNYLCLRFHAQVILLYFSDAMTYTLCVFTYRSPIIPLMYSPYRKTQKSFIFTSKKYEY